MKNVLSILLLVLLLQGEVLARGSSGRSYSSGSHSSSFGRSASFGSQSNSFGKSNLSFGNRSYSSAGSSSPKSYSSSPPGTSHSFGVNSVRPTGKSDSFGDSSSGGSKSYSSAGGNSFLGKSATGPKGNFNVGLTSAGQREDSRIAYERHYTTPAGTSKTYTPADRVKAGRIRSVDEARYQDYDRRTVIFYGNSRPTYYHDYWSPFLNAYLLSSAVSAFDRTAWVYHHRDSIDDYRYQELLARDAGLSARLQQMESQNMPRDPGYVLPTMANDPDLMYSKGFVDSARQQGPSVWSVAFWTLFVSGLVGLAMWLGFVKEW